MTRRLECNRCGYACGGNACGLRWLRIHFRLAQTTARIKLSPAMFFELLWRRVSLKDFGALLVQELLTESRPLIDCLLAEWRDRHLALARSPVHPLRMAQLFESVTAETARLGHDRESLLPQLNCRLGECMLIRAVSGWPGSLNT